MNVLSIDFDWIMEPVIEAYNDIAGRPRINYEDCWSEIRKRLPDNVFYCNNKNFLTLIKIIEKFPNKIVFGENHHEILDMIGDNKINMLVNIDQHHDCYGFPKDDPDTVHCGNWVDTLFKNNQIEQYVWVKTYTSVVSAGKFLSYSEAQRIIEDNVDFVLRTTNFDRIFVCKSPTWISPECIPLWDVLVNYYNIICKNDILKKSEE